MMKRTYFNSSFLTLMLIAALPCLGSSKAQAASAIKTGTAAGKVLIYEKSLNPFIGITATGSTAGLSYTIADDRGRTMLTGTVRPGKTFYIPTGKLPPGKYSFRLGDETLQQFIIR